MPRPAMELRLEYIHDCFGPDDEGLYERSAIGRGVALGPLTTSGTTAARRRTSLQSDEPGRRRSGPRPPVCFASSRIRGRVVARPAMGKLAHEPGKTGATRANVRRHRRRLRVFPPVCANATPAHLVVLSTEPSIRQTVSRRLPKHSRLPNIFPTPLVQGLRYNTFCVRRAHREVPRISIHLVLFLERSARPRQRLESS